MSRAVVFQRYGGPDVLEVMDVALDDPGPGQVLVRTAAAGLQPFDAMFRSGAAHAWLPATFPQGLGSEFAGTVEAVGPDAGPIEVGAAVLGWASATHAERVIASAGAVVAKPAAMPWVEAGCLSASGQTAATVLTKLGVGPGDLLLVHGASGGVGSFAVQVARARGADVIGTAREANHAYLRGLGAEPVVYGDGLAERVRATADRPVTVALDVAGTTEAIEVSVDLVADRDRIGTIVSAAPAEQFGVRRLGTERSLTQLQELVDLYVAGEIKVHVQQVFPLDQAADAHRIIETGHVRGKLVMVP